jgi:cytochrome c oxidase subunit 4
MSTDTTHSDHAAGHAADHDLEHVKSHVRLFYFIGAGLLLLTVVTVWLSYIEFGSVHANIAIGLVVATIKATMVGMVFMHLKWERKWVYVIMGMAFAFFGALIWLFCWAHSDPIKPVLN